MATYIQGVTDYIPQFQPFQPDLNFYAKIMQTKQSQYDSNWKALNKVYGQYFYADLTREPNIKKKEDLLKQIEFNLKRVSGLDLSLEQNVNQATQVFKPFYQDGNLMKDMAWTKTFNRESGRAQALRGSANEADRKQYWDTGLKELQYKREEFKTATDEEAMSFGNVAYTPYVNTMEKALKIAKDAWISAESVTFSDDQRWIITQKNGKQLIEPLSKLFEATLGADPSVQAVYRTQAYVNRKDYAFANAAEFNGDQKAAEMKYLEDSFNILKQQRETQYNRMEKNSKVYDERIKNLESLIAQKKAPVDAEEKLEVLRENKKINDSVLGRIQQESEMFSNSNSTATTSSGWVNPYEDINTLRYKVDAGMASTLMQKDLGEAAEIYAYRDSKTSVKENPYKVLEIKHAQEMQQIQTAGAYKIKAQQMANESREKIAQKKIAADKQSAYEKWAVDSGHKIYEEFQVTDAEGNPVTDANGNPVMDIRLADNPNQKVRPKPLPSLTVDPKKPASAYDVEMATLDVNQKRAKTQSALEEIFGILDDPNIRGKISPGDLAKIIDPNYVAPGHKFDKVGQAMSPSEKAMAIYGLKSQTTAKTALTPEQIAKGYKQKGSRYLFNLSEKYGDTYVTGVARRLDDYLAENAQYVPQMQTARQSLSTYSKGLIEYDKYEDAVRDWKTKADGVIAQQLSNKKVTKYLSAKPSSDPYTNLFNKLFSSDKEYNLKLTDRNNRPFVTKSEFIAANKVWSDWAKGYYTGQKMGVGYGAPGAGGLGVTVEEETYSKAENNLWEEYLSMVQNISQNKGIPAPPSAVSISGKPVNNAFQNAANEVTAEQKGGIGRTYYNDMYSSLRSLDFDGDKNIITYGGFTQTAMKDANTPEMQQKLSTLFNDFNTYFNDFSTKKAGVDIGGVLFAAGERDKVGNFVRIPKEFLDKYYNQSDPDKGFLSKEMYDGILQNGLSFIGDKNTLNNSLIEGTYSGPLESRLRYYKKLDFVDPIGCHKLNFSVPKTVDPNAGIYSYNTTLRIYNQETGKYDEFTGLEQTFSEGQDISDIQADWESTVDLINKQNTNIKYGLQY
jgi:hypothetical protein